MFFNEPFEIGSHWFLRDAAEDGAYLFRILRFHPSDRKTLIR
jgi:hypothetical protein